MKTKLHFRFLITLILSLFCIQANAQTIGDTFVVNDITYEVTLVGSSNEVMTTDYSGAANTAVVIPSTVNDTSGNSYSVTEIGTYSFWWKLIASVEIPNTVTKIGEQAFWRNSLTTIDIPNSVTEIDRRAFDTNLLTSLIIPDNLITISEGAFARNAIETLTIGTSVTTIEKDAFSSNSLTSVTIPESVTSIGEKAFESSSITEVILASDTPPTITSTRQLFNGSSENFRNETVDLTVPVGFEQDYMDAGWTGFKSINGIDIVFIVNDILYERISTTTTDVTAVSLDYSVYNVSITIPDTVTYSGVNHTVTKIADNAFEEHYLTGVIIGNAVTTIGEEAFSYNSLTSITIPANVISIGDNAFIYNTNLIEVISESSNPATLPSNTFSDNSTIDLTIPTGLEQIYLEANWVGFKTINTVEYNFTIGDFVYAITDITNTKVGVLDYTGTNTTVTIPATVSNSGISYSTTSLQGGSFYNKSLESISIPNTVTEIGAIAFYGNSFTSVTIPSSVTSIGISAFSGNSTLTAVISESTNPATLPVNAFVYNGDNSAIDLTIPTGTEQVYIDADWTGFNSVTEDSALSLVDETFSNTINIYPNPVQNTLNVNLATSETLQSVQVFNLLGKKVLQTNTTTVDFSTIPSGIYILKIENIAGKVAVRKIIKE